MEGPPCGALLSVGGVALPAGFSAAISVATAVGRSYGVSLNSPHPINLDAPIAAFSGAQMAWRYDVTIADTSTTAFADLVAALRSLHAAMFLTNQMGTVVAERDVPGSPHISFIGAIASMPYQFLPKHVYHLPVEITIDVLSDFAAGG